jgi:TonB family protein
VKGRDFLSLPPLPWALSVGTHLAFILSVLFIGRSHFLDLTTVTLDFAPSKATALYQPQKEDIWQKPMLRRIARLPLPKPKEMPTPQPAAQAAEIGQGTGAIRSIAQVSQLPHFINQVKPLYPDSAKSAGIEGVVIMPVDIDATGAVMDVEVLQGLGSGCDEAAAAAMKQSTFTPAYAGSEPVPVRIKIPYRFQING